MGHHGGATMTWERHDKARRVAAIALLVMLSVGACSQATAVAVSQTQDQHNGGPVSVGQIVLNALPVCLLALAATVPLGFLGPLSAAVTVTLASVALQVLHCGTIAGVIAVVLAAYRLGATGAGRRRQFVAIALAVPFLVMAVASRDFTATVLASCVPIAAGTGFAIRAGRSESGEDEARAELSQTMTEHLARGERARIVRELHDVVAHHISMIAVRAETARLTTPGMPEAGAERLREIGDTARAGLTEMRRLLGVLREDVAAREVGERQPQPGLPQVATLVDEAREAASGGSVRLIVSGSVTSFDPGTELVAYRIVQEALTNARRHAPGAAVDVEVRYDEDTLRLRIRDNGPGPGDAVPASGHGLLGMRERAATVGGTVHTGAAPGGGFLVEAALPVKPDGVTGWQEVEAR
jgi:signal transduction histidine kinase